jgi:hypothetical protein
MGEKEILEMLATEADRRVPTIIKGLRELGETGEQDPNEIALVQRIGPGTVQPSLATRMVAAITAFRDGANAAAADKPEPPSVEAALSELRAKPDPGFDR